MVPGGGGVVKHEINSRMKNLALEIIRVVEGLPRTEVSQILGRQILRSATSVGANYRSACRARSRADFIARVAIAEEEADETQYWLELLHEWGPIHGDQFERLVDETDQLTAILAASGKTAKEHLKN